MAAEVDPRDSGSLFSHRTPNPHRRCVITAIVCGLAILERSRRREAKEGERNNGDGKGSFENPFHDASSRTSSVATSSFCPLATTWSPSSGSARCSFKASDAGAAIHISISSRLVRMTGMAFA